MTTGRIHLRDIEAALYKIRRRQSCYRAGMASLVGLIGLTILALFLMIVRPAHADSKGHPFHEHDLVGSWCYVRAYQQLVDGTKVEQFGANPKGMFILLPNHRYSHIVMRDDLPKILSKQISKMTAEESKALAEGQLSHFGTWTANPRRGTFLVRILYATFPNLNGIAQTRRVLELTKTMLRYVNLQTTAGKGATVYAVLRRC